MSEVCCICLDGYEEAPGTSNAVNQTQFPCGHRVHTSCFRQYVRNHIPSLVLTCPICRQPVFEETLAPSAPTLIALFAAPAPPIRPRIGIGPPTHEPTPTDIASRRGMLFVTSFFLLMLLVCMLLVSVGYLIGDAKTPR